MADATVICVGGAATSAGFGPSLPGANLLVAVNACRARADFGYSDTAGVWITTEPTASLATADLIAPSVSGTALVIGIVGSSISEMPTPSITFGAVVSCFAGSAVASVPAPIVTGTVYVASPEDTNMYDVGDLVRLTGTFAVSNYTADPTTVTLKVQDPSGNETTLTYALGQVVKSATGVYYYDLTIDEAGTWYYRWSGTGAVVAASEGWLRVRESEFA